jgi:hypothetical protein
LLQPAVAYRVLQAKLAYVDSNTSFRRKLAKQRVSDATYTDRRRAKNKLPVILPF